MFCFSLKNISFKSISIIRQLSFAAYSPGFRFFHNQPIRNSSQRVKISYKKYIHFFKSTYDGVGNYPRVSKSNL